MSYELGELVARIQLDAPTPSSFVLRATVPIPPGVHPLPGGQVAFTVRGPDGAVTPAQLATVSRYATLEQGADVVEVLSRVTRPAANPPGSRIEYEVLYSPHATQTFTPTAAMTALVQAGVQLETRDVFGHLYRADLLRDLRDGTSDLRTLRAGAAAHQVRTHEILVPVTPVAGTSGTLAHHVAVHAYVTRWQTDEVVSLDLRIYNGGSGSDPADPLDDPNREVYFDELELVVPQGWNAISAFDDPFRGTDAVNGGFNYVSLVSPLAGGKLHVMPMQANMTRRLVLYRDGHLTAARAIAEEETLGFCMDGSTAGGKRLASWWNPQTPRYLAQRQPMPRLDALDLGWMDVELESGFATLSEAVANGTSAPWPFPILSPGLGWAHPYGHGIGYAHGGEEIEAFPGVDVAFLASRAGYRSFQLSHRMYNARHATTLYDADGEPTRLEDWLRPGGPTGQWNPTWVWIKPVLWLGDPFGFNSAPTFQIDAVYSMGKVPDYQAALFEFQHIDDQHLVRYTRPAKVLAWLGNDALAKDDLIMQAELVRLTYSDYPNDIGGNGIAIGMYVIRQFVDQFPNQGARVHRGTGWEIDAVATAYALAPPAWRLALETWSDSIVDLLEQTQDSCTGALGSYPTSDLFNAQYRARQSISESILENALWGLRRTVYADRRPEMSARLGAMLISSGYAMISDLFWNSTHGQPHFYVALGPHDATEPPFCSYVPPDGYASYENYQGWPTLAYAYRLTGDGAFLNHALEMAGGNVELVPTFGRGYLQNAAPAIALFQELGS